MIKQMRRASPTLALVLLTGMTMIGFIDRVIMNSLVEPIKAEFHLSDTEVGMVTGLAFSLLYAFTGVVVARLAERHRRISVIALGGLIWSVMTALCGFATSFPLLLAARVGVGAGEAIGIPQVATTISDYYPKEKRVTAHGLHTLGVPFGAVIGAIGGTMIAHNYGWQYALIAAAVPGIFLSLAVYLFLEEPKRGQFDEDTDPSEVPPLSAVLRRFWERKTLRHMLIGSALASMVGFGFNTFFLAYLQRRFGFSLVEAGITSGLIASLPASISISMAAWIADKWGERDQRIYALLPAITLFIGAPIYALGVLSSSSTICIILVGISTLVQFCFLGVTFGTFQNMMHPRMRATSSAITALTYSLISGGLGPVLLGAMSDFGGRHAPTPGVGLGWAMAAATLIYWWAAWHYARAAKTIREELALPL